MEANKGIYFDNSATTPVSDQVADYVCQLMQGNYGNPSSAHSLGIAAEQEVKKARESIANSLGCQQQEIIFTSGGTESNNLAIKGAALAYGKRGRHIITTAIEHPSVLNPCKHLAELGYEVDILPVDQFGKINLSSLAALIRPDTILVSIMLVNNEVGTIQPVGEVGKLLRGSDPRIFFHVDAVQAYGKIRINPKALGIDLLSASGHKLQAPKGVGFLYVANGVRLQTLSHGGGQERGLRSGTENTPGICGLGLAARLAHNKLEANLAHIQALREAFLEGLSGLADWQLNAGADALPYVVNICFQGIKSEVMLRMLTEAGLYVSAGSACGATKDVLSPVLTAMGLSREQIEGSLRFSFSPANTLEEAVRASQIVKTKVEELRQILE